MEMEVLAESQKMVSFRRECEAAHCNDPYY
jgi:hypothetical protein